MKIPLTDVSIDTPLNEYENMTIGDTLQSDFTIESVLSEIIGSKEEFSPEMKRYLGRLSKIQIRVLELMADGYSSEEIKSILHIDTKLYLDCIAAIRSYKNVRCISGLVRRR